MRFTTLAFFIFFILTYLIYWNLKGRSRIALLFIASLVFYAAWSLPFALHFFVLVAINYLLASWIFQNRSRTALSLALVLNLGNLFFFKYFYLFLQILHDLSGQTIFEAHSFNDQLQAVIGAEAITLPLAISFYTFQMVAFAVDTYRGSMVTKPSFLDYSVFILFFPQLIAGPIMRHNEFLPQLDSVRPKETHIQAGIFLIILGLIKKVVIADNMAPAIADVYANPQSYDAVSVALAPFGYAVRVYNDFAGYTDIARGVAFMLGFQIPANFLGPYLSKSARELWRRWHVTLSSWLRDYIYIPLGGSRSSPLRANVNLVITFTLGGLWHGASYTYIAWGFYHGVILVVERLASALLPESILKPQSRGKALSYLIPPVAVVYAFVVFVVGLIFFNAPDMSHAWSMFGAILTFQSGVNSSYNEFIVQMVAVTFLFNWLEYKERSIQWNRWLVWMILLVSAVIGLILLGRFSPEGADFIYFQF